MGENKFGEPWVSYSNDGEIEYEKNGERTYCKWSEFLHEHIIDRICVCVNACAGMGNPEKEIAEKDAEIARLKDDKVFMDLTRIVAETTKDLFTAQDEIARLKQESTEMLNIAVEIATEKLRADNAAPRAMLKKYEWVQLGSRHRTDFICLDCGWNKAHGHAPGCEIDRLLKGEKP